MISFLRFCAKVSPINSITVVVTGPTTRHYDVVVEPGMGFAGIRLRPGFFHAILGLSPVVLRDGNLVGEAAIGACPPLTDLCTEATSPDELPGRLVAFVQHRIALGNALPPKQTLRILSALHASGGRLPVQDIARMQDISTRTVQRIVRDATGCRPKPMPGYCSFTARCAFFATITCAHPKRRLRRDMLIRPI